MFQRKNRSIQSEWMIAIYLLRLLQKEGIAARVYTTIYYYNEVLVVDDSSNRIVYLIWNGFIKLIMSSLIVCFGFALVLVSPLNLTRMPLLGDIESIRLDTDLPNRNTTDFWSYVRISGNSKEGLRIFGAFGNVFVPSPARSPRAMTKEQSRQATTKQNSTRSPYVCEHLYRYYCVQNFIIIIVAYIIIFRCVHCSSSSYLLLFPCFFFFLSLFIHLFLCRLLGFLWVWSAVFDDMNWGILIQPEQRLSS